MSDEKTRAGRGGEVQGELEGLMSGDPAPGAPPPEATDAGEPDDGSGAEQPRTGAAVGGSEAHDEAEAPTGHEAVAETGPEAHEPTGEEVTPASETADAEAPEPAGPPPEDVERLSRALEMLEERVTLLLERHAELEDSHRETVEELTEKRARLDRLRGEGEDPERLVERIRALESENERLSEHAKFLEGRIEGLLNRVRYVVES